MLRTAAQRHNLCVPCPVARVADIFGDSCTLLILRDLIGGPKRYGELQASLAGISSRTLTKKLQRLEKEGFIARKEYKERPPRVVYTLSKKGAAFQDVVDAMRVYGKKYLA